MLYLDIFDKDYVDRTPATGLSHSRDIDYLKRLYVFNDDSIAAYYRERNFSVKNTNIISRLIEHFPIYLGQDVYSFLDSMDNRITYLGKHFRFTSDVEKGVMHPPYFFGNEGNEVIFAGSEPFDAIKFSKNWKTESCLRVLKHPRNDDKMLLPLGSDDGSRSGVSTIYIDLPKLAVKYREFVRQYEQAENREGLVLSKNHFVMKYVLPNTMKDVIDHNLLNRIMDKFYGYDQVSPKKRYPFKIYEPTTQVDRYVDNTLDMLTSKSMDFVQMLRHIKLVFAEDASQLLCLPELYGNRQVQPAVTVSRIDYMVFMLEACKNKDINRHYINDWKRLVKRIEGDSSLSNFLPYEVELDVKEKMKRIASY